MGKVVLLFCLCMFVGGFSHADSVKPFELPVHASSDTFKLSDYLGKKKIVLNFFASWCVACVKELPELNALKKKFEKDGVIFVGINAGERKKMIKKFLRKNKFEFLIIEDEKKMVAKQFGVEALPQTIVISKEKKVIYQSNLPPKEL